MARSWRFRRRKYDGLAKIVMFDDAVRARLTAMPGVSAAGAASSLPFSYSGRRTAMRARTLLCPRAPLRSRVHCLADAGYLKAIGLTLLRGRWFVDGDTANSPRVVVVDRVMVDRYWRDQDPIGKRIFCGSRKSRGSLSASLGPSKTTGWTRNLKGDSLFPASRSPRTRNCWSTRAVLIFVARTAGEIRPRFAKPMRDAVRSVDPRTRVRCGDL